MHIFPWLHELCAAFPWYWKGAFLLPNQASAQRRSSLDCLSFKGNSVQWTSNQRAWASSLVYLPNVLEKWRGEEAGVVFLSTEALELVFVHGNDYTVVPGCYQTLVCRVCDIAILPWLYELALFSFSLIWTRRNSDKSGFCSKEIKFVVAFKGWKHQACNHCSENRGNILTYLPQSEGEL